MSHDAVLILTVAAGLGVALVLGFLAVRLGLPPLVGYLVAGIVVGPFTPGYVADSGLSRQLAELGVILLMFGVGLHFSLRDLAEVRRPVVPGAVIQALLTSTVGAALGYAWGLGSGGAIVVGLSIGVASTVVVLKGLEGRDRLDSPEGRLAIGWLVVEDLLMVLVLVLLPVLAPALGGAGETVSAGAMVLPVAIAIAKALVFVLLMFYVGRRFVPWMLERVARLGSRELFTLAVFAIALGVGTIAAELFGVSVPLGAFFAGVVIGESELSSRAAAEALPMQDAFAVLFFVSVGMLFDPAVVLRHPFWLLSLVAVVMLWKMSVAGFLLTRLGQPRRTALVLGASISQIGEFSFIVAALGISLGLITGEVQALITAVAIVTIALNTAMVAMALRLAGAAPAVAVAGASPRTPGTTSDPSDCSAIGGHVVLVGYGRVGATVAEALSRSGQCYVVVEEQERVVAGLRERGDLAIHGDATRREVLERAGIARARLLVVTAPEPIRARRIIEVGREMRPGIAVAVRTHSATEQAYYEATLGTRSGASRAIYAEREAALGLAHFALTALGEGEDEADRVVDVLRGQPTRPTETFSAPRETEAVGRGADG